MKHVLSISEIVQELNRETEPLELCATAEGEYDQDTSSLAVRLEAFLRQVHHTRRDECTRPDWLPRGETVHEHVAAEEAGAVARDIFRRWTRKLRESAAAVRRE